MIALAHEVARFRDWVDARLRPEYNGVENHGAGEWECDYPEWESLYAAVHNFLVLAAGRDLTTRELELLLYACARDNEDERILEELEHFPDIATQLVSAAVAYPDADARWQAAVLAGRIGEKSLLQKFLNDEAEYVRRRAGFAFQHMESRG